MLNNEKQDKIDKLRKQVKRYDDKGYKDTAAHIMLARLLGEYPAEGVSPRNAKKAAQEKIEHGE